MADIAAIFLDVRHVHDFGVLRMRVMREENLFHFTKAPGERDHLRLAPPLPREADHRVPVKCRFDLPEIRIRKRLRKIDIPYLGADHIRR